MKKQITQVLEAVESGCRTSGEVSDATGMSVKYCASYLNDLVQSGTICKKPGVFITDDDGRKSNFYEPA